MTLHHEVYHSAWCIACPHGVLYACPATRIFTWNSTDKIDKEYRIIFCRFTLCAPWGSVGAYVAWQVAGMRGKSVHR